MRGGAYRPTRLRVPCALTAHVTSDSSAAVSAGWTHGFSNELDTPPPSTVPSGRFGLT